MEILNIDQLSSGYGQAQIVFDLDVSLQAGEAVALVGRNGAGKSTTLRSIMGLVPWIEGEIRFRQTSIVGLPTHTIAQLGIGYVPEDRRIFSDLTVLDNLRVGQRPPRSGTPCWDLDRVFRLFPQLKALRSRRGSQMSGGEQQMLTLARTLMTNPILLLLDEPSEGLAPVILQQIASVIQQLKGEGLTILLAEQNIEFARHVCDRYYEIENGQITLDL